MFRNIPVVVKQEIDDETGSYCDLNRKKENVDLCNGIKRELNNATGANGDAGDTTVKIEDDIITEVKLEDGIPAFNDVDTSRTSHFLFKIEERTSIETDGSDVSKDSDNVVKSVALTEGQGYSQGQSTTDNEENSKSNDAEDTLTCEKKYKCKICDKFFVKKSNLRSHEITHTGETPYKCQYCLKGFNVRSNLNVHLRIHTGQRPHECDICKKSFRQAGQLKTHERIHKGEKPYQCNICTSSFRSSSTLITHLRTHTGERPFPCDLCSRSFTTSTSLKTHRVTHSGTMLYDCPVCGRQFNRRNNLNVHIKRHNKNRKFSCPMCSNGFVMRAHLLSHLKRWHNLNAIPENLKCDDSIKVFEVDNASTNTCEDEINRDTVIKAEDEDVEVKTECAKPLTSDLVD
ncbi:hypothetical protein ACF0H5_012563 [Mactra antiquata]